jgi:hypothetical protein
MTDKEKTIDTLLAFSINKMYNTAMLIENVTEKHGKKHAERIAELFCHEHHLPSMPIDEFMGTLASAMQRKMLLIDPDLDITDQSIIH